MEAYHRNTIESIQGVELWERHQVQLADASRMCHRLPALYET